ncbi:hypothetical protein QBA74_22800 [Streptomyces scabiei]|uniref:hypothetical protein n=1 Tax=Streptomyces scabiei TaxID=1930 RepID=UPI001B3078FD|nr:MULTISPECIES: hypothetical protein [unclassified Streptomyces]MBP5868786.1 hypothetical protein [Streptomyces sp. LBUM 1485]MBP5915291.1 hypothetical protein [Streptomyces sp. LBUM 1486]QTU55349.1 hypothetical protein F3K21_23055 [Streptomyces sp. LBUM 1480]
MGLNVVAPHGVESLPGFGTGPGDLEKYGLQPAVEGACIDVYPSRMALEMGGGRRAYHWAGGGRPVTVDIFDDVPVSDHARLASVNAQRTAHEQRQGNGNE